MGRFRSVVASCSLLAVFPALCACGDTSAAKHSTKDAAPDVPLIIILPPIQDAGHDTSRPVSDATTQDAGDASPVIEAGPTLTAVPLSTCVPSQYTAPMTIGGTEGFELLIDTGSATLGVASTSCGSCGVSPEYSPSATAVNEGVMTSSQYETGSWSGEVYQDTVRASTSPTVPLKFVAIETQDQFFVGDNQCDSSLHSLQGIVGLAPATSAVEGTNAFFDQLVATANIPNIFATELCDTSGTLWLGGFDPTFMTASPQYTPMPNSVLSYYYYAVNFTSVTVAGQSIPVATLSYPDSIVDTGTSVFMLPTAAFDAVTNAIALTPAFQQIFGFASTPSGDAGTSDAGGGEGGIGDAGRGHASAGDAATADAALGDTGGVSGPGDAGAAAGWFSNLNNCVVLPQTKAQLDTLLPPLTLVFGSSPSISVQAAPTESYLIQYDDYWCPAIYAMDPSQDNPTASILGAPVLRSNIVIFDRNNGRIGFAPHTACP